MLRRISVVMIRQGASGRMDTSPVSRPTSKPAWVRVRVAGVGWVGRGWVRFGARRSVPSGDGGRVKWAEPGNGARASVKSRNFWLLIVLMGEV